MHRRAFMLMLGGTALAPFGAFAQSGPMPRVGILVLGNPSPEPFMKEVREGLRELGYIEGQNIAFEFRNAQGSNSQLVAHARELVAQKVDIIIGYQTPAVTAAKEATAEIPIVMGMAGDPVGTGLIASLSRPGGNVTGVTGATAELGGKNVELIRDVMPSVKRVAVIANEPDPFHKPFVQAIEAAGKALGIAIKTVFVRGADHIEEGFLILDKDPVDAVIVQPSLPHGRSAELALKRRLPAFSPNSNFTAAGGLMAYSADQLAQMRESTAFVDKILKGRKPADLPVQLPTKFLLTINLKTAKALDFALPPALLIRADQVIE
jgi:putative tryptophan/tyrosine transport system substrate-binding protein